LVYWWTKVSAIRTNLLARNSGWMLAGLAGNSFLQAATFLLLTRLLGVSEYGVFAGAFALVNTVTPYSSLGSQMIFMRYVSADRNSAPIYWGNMLAVTAATTLFLMAALALVGGRLFSFRSVGLIMVLVVANCFMGQVTNNASMVFQTFEELKATAWLRMLSNLLRLLTILALVLLLGRATAFQCSLALLASSAIAMVVAAVWVRAVIGGARFSSRLLVRRFWEGIGFSVAGSTQSVYNDIDKVMLSHYGMNVANGIYTFAYRVVDFATIPVNSLDAACLPRYFALNNQSVSRVTSLAKKIVPIGALCGLAAAGFTLLASPFVVRIAGHGFGEALLALRWLCWLPALRGVHQLTGGVLTATGLQNYRTAAQFLVALLNFVLNLFWIPAHGWLGAAWASLVSDGSLAVLNLSLVILVLALRKQPASPNPGEEGK
jgi:O-antigen/teichoic acid export membrane protein